MSKNKKKNNKNYTTSFNKDRLKEMQDWYINTNPIDYASFSDFIEKSAWHAYQKALKK
jgi:hypothetical protein